jgi:hypothetical protein
MKKFTLSLMTAMLLFALAPMQLKAEPEKDPTPKDSKEVVMSEEAVILLARLDEIKAMDFSDLSSKERKELRKEVRAIKSELRELGSGIYISVGAAIIIILLLILIL